MWASILKMLKNLENNKRMNYNGWKNLEKDNNLRFSIKLWCLIKERNSKVKYNISNENLTNKKWKILNIFKLFDKKKYSMYKYFLKNKFNLK